MIIITIKKFKFDHTNKWYMHNPASVLENDTHKLLWEFDIQTDHIISARRPDLIIINKKKRTCNIVDFAVPADHRIKLKENEKRDKYLDLARELKKQSSTLTITSRGHPPAFHLNSRIAIKGVLHCLQLFHAKKRYHMLPKLFLLLKFEFR